MSRLVAKANASNDIESMTEKERADLLDELIAKYNRETRHLEFKSNYQDANSLGEYISALSNGATLDRLLRELRTKGLIIADKDRNWSLVET